MHPARYYSNTRPTHYETKDALIPPVHNTVAYMFGAYIHFVKICVGGSDKLESHAPFSYPPPEGATPIADPAACCFFSTRFTAMPDRFSVSGQLVDLHDRRIYPATVHVEDGKIREIEATDETREEAPSQFFCRALSMRTSTSKARCSHRQSLPAPRWCTERLRR